MIYGLHQIAHALGMTPTGKTRIVKDLKTRKWRLLGCIEGDVILPRTWNCVTEKEAIRAAGDWLAPELDALEATLADDEEK